MPETQFHTQTVRFVWEVDPSSPVETFLPGQARATARVRTAYDLRQPFLDLVVGYSYEAIVGGKRIIKRITPLEYPYHKGLYCVGATRVEGVSPGLPGMPPNTVSKRTLFRYAPGGKNQEPFTQPNLAQPDYLDAKIELSFSTLEYRIRPDSEVLSQDLTNGWIGHVDEGDALARGIKRYITRTAVDTGKLITVPGNFLYYKAFGIPIPASSGTTYQFSQDLIYTWYDIPESCLPYSAWAKCGGKVNKFDFDNYPAQTLLFKGYKIKEETSAFGDKHYTVAYTFRYLPNFDSVDLVQRGHNWVLSIGPKWLADGATANPNAGKLIYQEVCSRGSTGTTPAGQNQPTAGRFLPARPIAPMNGSPLFPGADFRDLFRAQQP